MTSAAVIFGIMPLTILCCALAVHLGQIRVFPAFMISLLGAPLAAPHLDGVLHPFIGLALWLLAFLCLLYVSLIKTKL